ncbi:hypothetical protein DMUE_1342 [Dictyocoela muelleri]|nr:hypothetical protein DMUE_1342 [Dictyocoela muelleri]
MHIKKCHVRKPFLFGNLLLTSKIPLNSYFLAIYEILCRDYEKRILNDCSISKRSLQKIKDNCNEFFIPKNETYRKKVLGKQYAVQIDETVIYKGKLIFSPSNMCDNTPGSTWIVEKIEEVSGDMIIEIVKDTKITTMTKLIFDHVRIGSLIITYGYSSYPQAVKNAMCNHEIVLHNIGFKNKKRFHTNNIENI